MTGRAALLLALALCILTAPAAGAATRWSRTPRLTATAQSFDLAATLGGNAAIAWLESVPSGGSAIAVARKPPASTDFDAALRIGVPTTSASSPDVAVDAAGNALVVWMDDPSGDPANPRRVWWSECSASCAPPQMLVDGGNEPIGDAQVGFLATGAAVVIWTQRDASTGKTNVLTATKSPAGGFGDPVVVGDAENGHPVLATGGDTTLVTWYSEPFNPAGTASTVAALRRGAEFMPLVRVETGRGTVSRTPSATVDAGGAATIAWIDQTDFPPSVGFVRTRSRGSFFPIEKVGVVGADPERPVFVASGAPGHLVVSWIGVTKAQRYRVEAAATRVGGRLRHRVLFTEPTRIPTDSNVSAAWTSNGVLAAAWMSRVPQRSQLRGMIVPRNDKPSKPVGLAAFPPEPEPSIQLATAGRQTIVVWGHGGGLRAAIR